MELIAGQPGNRLLQTLNQSSAVTAAVAFFAPSRELVTALRGVPRLCLTVSDEWTINNPVALRDLAEQGARVLCVSAELWRKLHSKVVLCTLVEGGRARFIGSANLTHRGLFQNEEATLLLTDPEDAKTLDELQSWLSFLDAHAGVPDWTSALAAWDRASRELPWYLRQVPAPAAHRHWAVKTTEGANGRQYWAQFVAEGVVAIGWPGIAQNPARLSVAAIADLIAAAYPSMSPRALSSATRKINLFANEVHIGDSVLLCRGYNSRQRRPVHVHGLAVVEGPCRLDVTSDWWTLKRDAQLTVSECDLPVTFVAQSLAKRSLLETIHRLPDNGFHALLLGARQEYGILLDDRE